MTVEPFVARRMTVDQYRRERAELRQLYGDTRPEAGAKADQALARLYRRSDWTQEELAREEGKSQSWIDYRLRFGRFLEFTTTVVKPENPLNPLQTLTEGRFREYWKRTDEKEINPKVRFQQVLALMQDDLRLGKATARKPKIGDAIVGTCGNGEPHRFTTIVTKVQSVEPDATPDDIRKVLKGMVSDGTYNVFAEKKAGDIYRIVKGGKTKIDLETLHRELGPILAKLKAEGRKNMATMSPPTVLHLACSIDDVLAKLAHHASPSDADLEE